MPPIPILSKPEVLTEFRRRCLAGESNKAVARWLGVSHTYIRPLKIKHGLPLKPHRGPSIDGAKVDQLWRAGRGYAEIARIMDLSRNGVAAAHNKYLESL